MEAGKAASSNEDIGQFVTDAVHPRLLPKVKEVKKAFCGGCNVHFKYSIEIMRQHFTLSRHRSQPCVYCRGPVYSYILMPDENRYFHECTLSPIDRNSLAESGNHRTEEIHPQINDSVTSETLSIDTSESQNDDEDEGSSILSVSETSGIPEDSGSEDVN